MRSGPLLRPWALILIMPSTAEEEVPPPAEGAAVAPSREISVQEKKQASQKREYMTQLLAYCHHVLKTVTDKSEGPALWGRDEFKSIRECVAIIKQHPDKFHPVHGDIMPDGSLVGGDSAAVDNSPTLTCGYVAAIAGLEDTTPFESPVLHVIAPPNMEYETTHSDSRSNSIHFTHLRLRDGDNEVIQGRLSMELAYDGKKLGIGDIIQLGLSTPLTFQP